MSKPILFAAATGFVGVILAAASQSGPSKGDPTRQS